MAQWKNAKAAASRASSNLTLLKKATNSFAAKRYLENIRTARNSASQAATAALTLADRAAGYKAAQKNETSGTKNTATGGKSDQKPDQTKSPEVTSPVSESIACEQQNILNENGEAILENVLSLVSVAAIGVSFAIMATNPVGAAILLGAGAASIIGGMANKAQGGSFFAGWVGGAIFGALTGLGLGGGSWLIGEIAGTAVASVGRLVGAFGASILSSAAGGGAGGFVGSAITQYADTGDIDFQEAAQDGAISAGIATLAAPFGFVASVMGEISNVAQSAVSSVYEFTFDTITALATAFN